MEEAEAKWQEGEQADENVQRDNTGIPASPNVSGEGDESAEESKE